MRLWTIQPEEIYQSILHTGKHQCDFARSGMGDFRYEYDWLAEQMRTHIGPPPPGVSYPVWAWHTYDGEHKQLDLRKVRWSHGSNGEKYVCMEIEVPDELVLLSDFDAWSIILLDGLLSDTEEEDKRLEEEFRSLPANEQERMKLESWKRALSLRNIHNEWTVYGDYIQAAFWELHNEWIKKVRAFVAAR